MPLCLVILSEIINHRVEVIVGCEQFLDKKLQFSDLINLVARIMAVKCHSFFTKITVEKLYPTCKSEQKVISHASQSFKCT